MSKIDLTYKQTLALDALENPEVSEVLFGGGAGGAKSFLGCLWIILMCLKYGGSKWLIGRSKLKALRQTTLMTFFEVVKILGLGLDKYRYNSQLGEIDFFNGSKVILKDLFLYPSDPNFDSLGSLEITGAFLDEVNQMCHKAVQIVSSRIRFKLTEFNITPKILMSCNPDKGWVYHEFYKPDQEGTIKNYRRFIQALATDNPFISPHYIENLKKLDEKSKQRLLLGNWEYDDDATKLFEYNSIIAMWSNIGVPQGGTRYITVDVARLGDDKTVIFIWEGWRIKYGVRFGKKKLTETRDIIEKLRSEWAVQVHNVIVDEDGVGGGLVDFGYYTGFVNNSKAKNSENYANLKSQCIFEIAKKVNNGEIYIEFTDSEIKAILIEDLEQLKDWNADKDDQKLRVIPKDKIKEVLGRSTDCSDAFMLRMYPELVPPPKTRKIRGLM